MCKNGILHISYFMIYEGHLWYRAAVRARAQERRSHVLLRWSRAATWAENNRWTLNPSISERCQLSMKHRVKFIFCKVRTCWWKNEVGTDHSVITSHPCSEFRHSLLCTGTATAHTCQSSLDLASLPVYKCQEWHAGIEYRDVHQPGLTLMCSWCELMLPGVVMPLMRRTCGAGAGHTSLLMTF